MATDLAQLSIRIESLEAAQAAARLDGMSRAGTKTERRMKSLGRTAKRLAGSFGLILSGGTLVAMFTGASTAARKFEQSIAEVSAITGQVDGELKRISDAALEMGRTTTLSSIQSAEAFKLIASAKPDLLENTEALIATTRETIALAEATGSTLPQAATTLGESLNQFGAGADQASRFINVLAAGAQRGASMVNETAEALKFAGAVAATSGISFEQVNATIQQLSKVGIKGSEAGAALRNTFLKLEGQMNARFKPSVVGLNTALANLRDEQLTTTELTKLFGLRSVVAASSIIKHADSVAELEKQLTNTSIAYDQQKTQVDTYEGAIKGMKSAHEGMIITIGQRLNPTFRALAETLTRSMNAFTDFLNVTQDAPQTIDGINKSVGFLAKSIFFVRQAFLQTGETIAYWGIVGASALEGVMTVAHTFRDVIWHLGGATVQTVKIMALQFQKFGNTIRSLYREAKALLQGDLKARRAAIAERKAANAELDKEIKLQNDLGQAHLNSFGITLRNAPRDLAAIKDKVKFVEREIILKTQLRDASIAAFNAAVDGNDDEERAARAKVDALKVQLGHTNDLIDAQKQLRQEKEREQALAAASDRLDKLKEKYATEAELARKNAEADLAVIESINNDLTKLSVDKEREKQNLIAGIRARYGADRVAFESQRAKEIEILNSDLSSALIEQDAKVEAERVKSISDINTAVRGSINLSTQTERVRVEALLAEQDRYAAESISRAIALAKQRVRVANSIEEKFDRSNDRIRKAAESRAGEMLAIEQEYAAQVLKLTQNNVEQRAQIQRDVRADVSLDSEIKRNNEILRLEEELNKKASALSQQWMDDRLSHIRQIEIDYGKSLGLTLEQAEARAADLVKLERDHAQQVNAITQNSVAVRQALLDALERDTSVTSEEERRDRLIAIDETVAQSSATLAKTIQQERNTSQTAIEQRHEQSTGIMLSQAARHVNESLEIERNRAAGILRIEAELAQSRIAIRALVNRDDGRPTSDKQAEAAKLSERIAIEAQKRQQAIADAASAAFADSASRRKDIEEKSLTEAQRRSQERVELEENFLTNVRRISEQIQTARQTAMDGLSRVPDDGSVEAAQQRLELVTQIDAGLSQQRITLWNEATAELERGLADFNEKYKSFAALTLDDTKAMAEEIAKVEMKFNVESPIADETDEIANRIKQQRRKAIEEAAKAEQDAAIEAANALQRIEQQKLDTIAAARLAAASDETARAEIAFSIKQTAMQRETDALLQQIERELAAETEGSARFIELKRQEQEFRIASNAAIAMQQQAFNEQMAEMRLTEIESELQKELRIADLRLLASEDEKLAMETRFEAWLELRMAQHARELEGEEEKERLLAAIRSKYQQQHEKEMMASDKRTTGSRVKWGKLMERYEKGNAEDRLNIVAGLTAGVAQHSKTMFQINKAAATAAAIMNTSEGVTKALAKTNFPMAALIAAAGAAEVAAIASTSFSGGGGGTTPSFAASPVVNDRPVDADDLLNPPQGATRQDERQVNQVIVTGNYGFTPEVIDQIADGLLEATSERDVIIFDENSRQAQDIEVINNG